MTYRIPDIPSAEFQPIGVLDDVYMDVPFALSENAVFMAASRDPAVRATMLTNIIIESAQVQWQVESEEWGQVVATSDGVYAEDNSGWGSSIVAYTAETGVERWRNHYNAHINHIAVVDSWMSVNTSLPIRSSFRRFFSSFYLLNLETGETIQRKGSKGADIFLVEGEERIYEVLPGSIRASEPAPWETKLDADAFYVEDVPYRYRPLVYDTLILLKTGVDQLGYVYALNKVDGSILWRTDDTAVGNIAASYGVVYFLTEDGRLMAVDATTGAPLGIFYFAPAPQALETFDYFIAAQADLLGVYLGDSRQLFIFRFAPPA